MASKRPEPPRFIRPQLTLLAESPPGGDSWAHELKLDGYRPHARIADIRARLDGRGKTGVKQAKKTDLKGRGLNDQISAVPGRSPEPIRRYTFLWL
jgi:hypothetical protein